jgi:alanyl-tRNA synthetase
MGFLFGGGKKAAQIGADATLKAANMQAGNDRLLAQAAQQALETTLAQKRASDKAAELLSKPQELIDVQLAPDAPAAEIDATTGRRKTTRSKFMSSTSGSGIHI